MTAETREGIIQEKGHITKDLFCDWQAGRMKPPQEGQFLGHIGICTYCAGRFGDWMEQGLAAPPETGLEEPPARYPPVQSPLLAEPPAYLKEEILRRTRQMDVQAAVCVKETSRRMQLILYSLKVSVAVMASIFLLAVTANVRNMEFAPEPETRAQEREDRQAEPGFTDILKQKSGEISNLLNSLSNGLFRLDTEEAGQDEIRR